MSGAQHSRPYFDAWLRRTGRQLAFSGRLTQTAAALASEDGSTVGEWRTRLRNLLDGNELPTPELLIRIDKLLAKPAPKALPGETTGLLF